MRRQQAQEESEARELGLQLQYNNGTCQNGPVLPATSSSALPTTTTTTMTTERSPPPSSHPTHVGSPTGLAIAAAAAAQIQTQLHQQHQQHQQSDCGGLLRMRVEQDDYTSSDKNDINMSLGSMTGKLLFIINTINF